MKVNTVLFSKTHPFCTLNSDSEPQLWGTKTKPGMGMPPLTETTEIAEPTETIAETGKQVRQGCQGTSQADHPSLKGSSSCRPSPSY